jgi:hypothetical protein
MSLSFGVRPNQFGCDFTDDWTHFCDPQPTNHHARFYRIRCP